MYFFTSSEVIPIPLSEIVIVFAFLSTLTSTNGEPTSPLNSPNEESAFNLEVASTAFDTNSLKKIS